MSKTIVKNLKLKASLDDQTLKRQLQELKKQFGDIQLGGNNLQNFDKSVKALNDAANSLKQAIGEMKKISSDGGGLGGGGRGRQTSGQQAKTKTAAETITEQITKNASKKVKEIFDKERGTYKTLKPGETYDASMGKKFRTDMQHQQALEVFKAKSSKKQLDEQAKSTENVLKKEVKIKEQQRRADINNAKNSLSAILSKTGMGLPMARQISGVIGEAAPGAFARVGAGVRGAGSAIGGMLSTPVGMLAGGALAAGAIGTRAFMSHQAASRRLRVSAAGEQQETGAAMMEGRGLEGTLKRSARKDVGGFESAVSGGLGMLSVLNPFGQNFAANPLEAGRAAIRERQEGAQQAALAESELSRASLDKAKGLRQSRMTTMRGGLTGDQLTGAQAIGGTLGFGAEETLQQLQSAKQSLGGPAALRSLSAMQYMTQATGVGVGDQAQAAEVFTGAGRGQKMGAGVTQSIEVLKKGVAAGLDVSKSGQFLKMTADYISSTQGLGQLDVGALSTKLAESARGFAGGGDVTETSLQQARALQEQIRTESTATGGFAGLGNIAGIQSALGPNATAAQVMGAQTLSSTATVEDAMESLGIDKETATKLMSAKQNTLGAGFDIAGIKDPTLRTALMARETGQTTEQALGRTRAQGFQAGGLDIAGAEGKIGAAAGATLGSKEAQSLIVDFKTQQTAFVQGMGLMTTETGKANENLKIFNSELLRSVKMLNKYLGQTMDNSGQ